MPSSRLASWFESVSQDARYSLRGLRRSPAFTITVVLTLGLGIGANTAMFGIIDRLMFRPYPFMRDQNAVHRVYLQDTYRGSMSTNGVSEYTRYLDLAKWTSSFAQSAGFTNNTLAIGVGEATRERPVGIVSASFFSFFDAPPALGRYFTAAEDTTPRGADVVVLSYGFWKNEFGGRDVRGQTLQVNNILCTIIGVTPKGFVGIFEGNPPAVYIPITTFAGASPMSARDPSNYYTRYNWGWMDMMVRRKDGVSMDAASADLSQAYVKSWAVMMEQQGGGTPATEARPHAIAGPLKQAAGPDPSIEAKMVRWVSGIAIIVLLIACSNVANLFLARALRRRRETAVRIALGVARRRLVAQWFTESIILALIGCAAGVIIAQVGGASMRALFVGTGAAIPVASDWRTLGVSITLALVAAVLAGIAPTVALGRGGVAGALKAGNREGTYHRSKLRTALLFVQVTLSVVLLVGAGVFVRSFSHVQSLRLGYDADPMVLVSRNLRGMRIPDSVLFQQGKQILQTVQALPGVEHAALASSIPFWSTSSTSISVAGIDSVQRLGRFTYQTATADYFATMNTRILRGRGFTDADRAGTEKITIVSEAMAKVLWPNEDAIGKCINVGKPNNCYIVVGIAENTSQNDLDGNDKFRYYIPMEQYGSDRASYLLTRVHGNVTAMGEMIRKAVQPLMPGQAYVTTRPMRDLVSGRQRAWRFGATMFLAFGVLALVVAAIGLYGVIGYSVAQRMHELGVRIALGAQKFDLIKLVMTQGVRVALAGIVAGLGIALAVSSKVQPLLFKQSARDPVVFGAVAGVLLLTALAACAAPARKAAKADPNASLRAD
ncbi:MAG TPA: ADOP family duplicated permease [Gemmatimonadaceae bacterium]|nr:ADOP family duplicated permease [Gemmatimonadaceae bacterium]